MTITYAGTQLAGAASGIGPKLVILPAAQMVDEVALFRADSMAVYPRGNVLYPLEFTVLWNFNTRALCEQFLLTHVYTLPRSGSLVIVCGDGESTTYTYTQAGSVLLRTPEVTLYGTSIQVRYQFTGGPFILT